MKAAKVDAPMSTLSVALAQLVAVHLQVGQGGRVQESSKKGNLPFHVMLAPTIQGRQMYAYTSIHPKPVRQKLSTSSCCQEDHDDDDHDDHHGGYGSSHVPGMLRVYLSHKPAQ